MRYNRYYPIIGMIIAFAVSVSCSAPDVGEQPSGNSEENVSESEKLSSKDDRDNSGEETDILSESGDVESNFDFFHSNFSFGDDLAVFSKLDATSLQAMWAIADDAGYPAIFTMLSERSLLPGNLPDEFSTSEEKSYFEAALKSSRLPAMLLEPEGCSSGAEDSIMQYNPDSAAIEITGWYFQSDYHYDFNRCEAARDLYNGYPAGDNTSLRCSQLTGINDTNEIPVYEQALRANGAYSTTNTGTSFVFEASSVDGAFIGSKPGSGVLSNQKFELSVPMDRELARQKFAELSCGFIAEPVHPFYRRAAYLYQGRGRTYDEYFIHPLAFYIFDGEEIFASVDLQSKP